MTDLNDVPLRVKQTAVFGGLLGAFILLGYCASAATGQMGWGKALAFGALRFALIWGIACALRSGNQFTWWALLIVVVLRVWKGLSHTFGMAGTLIRDGFDDQDQAIAFGVIGMANWVIGGILLRLLLSKEVRGFVFGPRNKAAHLS